MPSVSAINNTGTQEYKCTGIPEYHSLLKLIHDQIRFQKIKGVRTYTIAAETYMNSKGITVNKITLIEATDGYELAGTLKIMKGDSNVSAANFRFSVGTLKIGGDGKVTVTPHARSNPGDVQALQSQLQVKGIKTRN